MKRFAIICLIFCAFNIVVNAQEKPSYRSSRLTYGLEWGYVATIYSNYYYYFLAPEGYRVEDKGSRLKLHNNAEIYAHVGYNFNSRWNLSLYVGYEGLADFHKAVPISLRLTRFFGQEQMEDRWFFYGDVGSGICLKISPQEIFTGKLGFGYRMALSMKTSLDFIMAARLTYTHPQIFYEMIPIPAEMTNSNIANLCSFSVGMALTF